MPVYSNTYYNAAALDGGEYETYNDAVVDGGFYNNAALSGGFMGQDVFVNFLRSNDNMYVNDVFPIFGKSFLETWSPGQQQEFVNGLNAFYQAANLDTKSKDLLRKAADSGLYVPQGLPQDITVEDLLLYKNIGAYCCYFAFRAMLLPEAIGQFSLTPREIARAHAFAYTCYHFINGALTWVALQRNTIKYSKVPSVIQAYQSLACYIFFLHNPQTIKVMGLKAEQKKEMIKQLLDPKIASSIFIAYRGVLPAASKYAYFSDGTKEPWGTLNDAGIASPNPKVMENLNNLMLRGAKRASKKKKAQEEIKALVQDAVSKAVSDAASMDVDDDIVYPTVEKKKKTTKKKKKTKGSGFLDELTEALSGASNAFFGSGIKRRKKSSSSDGVSGTFSREQLMKMIKNGTKVRKGSQAAKDKMALLRSMRGKNGSSKRKRKTSTPRRGPIISSGNLDKASLLRMIKSGTRVKKGSAAAKAKMALLRSMRKKKITKGGMVPGF